MKKLRNRLMSIWRLMLGRNFVLISVHRRKDQYLINTTDCITLQTLEDIRNVVDIAIEHLNLIKNNLIDMQNGKETD